MTGVQTCALPIWLVDLGHKSRWDLQDREIGKFKPCDINVPATPGRCILKNDVLINRMNGTQASIWQLGVSEAVFTGASGYTDTTDSTVFLALFGPKTFRVAEKLTSLDFTDPDKQAPFLLQGPVCRVPCQIVTLEKNADASGGILLTCSRGYAKDMIHAILDAGAEFNRRPAGENRFTDWVRSLQQSQQ